MKTLGFREMHEDQIAELLRFIDNALNCAAMASPEIYEEMHEQVQDLVQIFGGVQYVTESALEI